MSEINDYDARPCARYAWGLFKDREWIVYDLDAMQEPNLVCIVARFPVDIASLAAAADYESARELFRRFDASLDAGKKAARLECRRLNAQITVVK